MLKTKVTAFVTLLFVLCSIFSASAFVHPGIALTLSDLQTIKANLTNQPWASGYAALVADSHSSTNYNMQGPFGYVNRNNGGNYDNENAWKNDMQAIYNLARMWYFTGDANYAKKSHDILIAWANTMTNFGGIEASFDIGDYAYRYAGGADILRGTWSGWTTSDTATAQNYFGNVLWPCLGFPGPEATGSQGMEGIIAGAAIAVFNDDTNKFNQVLSELLTDADSGLRDTLANGEVGDTGRDQGHTSLYIFDLAFTGEVFWKQGVDVFSVYDNRIMACGEYYARYNLPGSTPPFVAMGAPFWGVFWNISGSPRSSGQNRMALNVLHGAYAIRKGLSTPWIDAYCNDQNEDGDSFMYRKSADPSFATPPAIASLPSTASVSSGLTGADLNGCTPAGSTTYGSGTWTLQGGFNGGDPWNGGADTERFAYKQITGDFVMVAKVNSIANVGSVHSKAGIMLRDSLGSAVNEDWVAITANTNYERCLFGWTGLPYGSNAAKMGSNINPPVPYWVRMERVGNRIQTYTSPDGGDWSPAATADFANMPATMYVGLFTDSQINGTLTTAVFSNVFVTGGDNGAPLQIPPAPFAVYASPGSARVTLRWNESFTATSYTVKRSTTSGSGYSTIATVNNTTYVDTGVNNGTTYYYVVTASNAAGQSGNSMEDSVTPQSAMANVAVGGTPQDNVNDPYGSQGAVQAFDTNPGSKWLSSVACWLQYDFGSGNTRTVKRYAITSANDVPGRDPRNWQFQASNDGSTWTTLDTQTSQNSFTYRYQTKTFAISSPGAYRFYRLNVSTNNGDTLGTQISELALLTDSGHTIPNGTYRLLNRNSNKAMDISGGGTTNGSPVDQWTYNGGNNQRWTLTDLGNGQYQVIGVGSGRALDIPGLKTTNGLQLDIWDWNSGSNQKWIVTPMGEGFFRLNAVLDSDAVDVNGGSSADGASVIQWPNNTGLNQQWSITVAP